MDRHLANADAVQPYGSILFVIGLAVAMAIAILVLTHLIGPRRHGSVKQGVYESGMPPVADARRRFNVRFYIVAMLFLLFDVEVVILWPWALAYYRAAAEGQIIDLPGLVVGKGFLLAGAAVFLLLLLVGYIYEWRKGVFKWD
jgi:NADH-quinone oxidoreductase subunit A